MWVPVSNRKVWVVLQFQTVSGVIAATVLKAKDLSVIIVIYNGYICIYIHISVHVIYLIDVGLIVISHYILSYTNNYMYSVKNYTSCKFIEVTTTAKDNLNQWTDKNTWGCRSHKSKFILNINKQRLTLMKQWKYSSVKVLFICNLQQLFDMIPERGLLHHVLICIHIRVWATPCFGKHNGVSHPTFCVCVCVRCTVTLCERFSLEFPLNHTDTWLQNVNVSPCFFGCKRARGGNDLLGGSRRRASAEQAEPRLSVWRGQIRGLSWAKVQVSEAPEAGEQEKKVARHPTRGKSRMYRHFMW